MGIDVYCVTFGGDDGFPYLTPIGPLTSEALEKGVRLGRGWVTLLRIFDYFNEKLSDFRGKGSIYVVGSGSRSLSVGDQNINFDGYATSPYTIAVGGIEGPTLGLPTKAGFHAYGSALLVVAPTGTGRSHLVRLIFILFSHSEEHWFLHLDYSLRIGWIELYRNVCGKRLPYCSSCRNWFAVQFTNID